MQRQISNPPVIFVAIQQAPLAFSHEIADTILTSYPADPPQGLSRVILFLDAACPPSQPSNEQLPSSMGRTIQVPGFGPYTFPSGEEKGIDVRLALEALDAAHQQQFDVALIFSQDQDLSELAALIRQVAKLQNRWIKIASAFPDAPGATNRRGINRTDWCPFDKALYDPCIDPRDYRPTP